MASTTTTDRPFRINAKTLALTFPQTETTKEAALQRIKQLWNTPNQLGLIPGGGVSWAVVSTEQHLDGHPHLHCAVMFNRRRNWTNCHFADFIAGSHGNYESMRSVRSWMVYITKKDREPAVFNVDWKVNVPFKHMIILK